MNAPVFPRLEDDQVETPSLREFLGDILPPGRLCAWTKDDRRHHWVESLDELAARIERFGNRLGVYFGTAAFGDELAKGKDGKPIPGRFARTQANVSGRKCFHLDLDAGRAKIEKHGDAAVYETQRAALHDIARFCRDAGLPPSYIVSSGEGLHVYWAMGETIDGQSWTRIAKLFSKLLERQGVKQDYACTADSARILRPLGTMHENGKRVEIVKATGKVYDLGEFTGKVAELLGATTEPAPAERRTTGINGDVLSKDTSRARNDTPHDFHEIVSKCQAVRKVAELRGNVSEPLWRAALGIVKHCEDADTLAHEISDGHPDYDQGETRSKLDAWTAGPTTCATLEQFCKTECSACEHRGKITSPIQLDTQHQRQQPRVIQLATGVTKPNGAALRQHMPDWHGKEGDDGAFTKNRPMNTTDNVAALAALTGFRLRLNVMTRKPEIHQEGLKTTRDDYDNAALAKFGDVAVRAGLSRTGLAELTDAVAGDSPYHPCLEWIEATPWDGTSRRALFHKSFELADKSKAPMASALIDAFMLQGVGALLEERGISAQGVLVLSGPQGCNKTRKVENLCPLPGAVLTGLHIDPTDKDHVMQATSAWITELGELDTTTRKADVGALKAFITRDTDVVRPAYAKRENTYKRRTVFIGTVNGTGFLVDDTGNRRFWVLEVNFCHLLAPDEMRQIWAEYLHLYRQGDRWHLDETTRAALNESNLDHTAVDPLQELIASTFKWDSVDWSRVDPKDKTTWEGVEWLTASEICGRVNLDGRYNATRAGGIIRDLQKGASLGGASLAIFRRAKGAKFLAVPRARGFG